MKIIPTSPNLQTIQIPDKNKDSFSATIIEKKQQEEKSSYSACLDSLGRAQVNLNKTISKPNYEEAENIINKIVQPLGMKVRRYANDKHISIGKSVEGFKNLYTDEMRAKCVRKENGDINEIFILDKSTKAVCIYDNKGNLKKCFNKDDMKALFEYKYHPEAIHNLLRNKFHAGIKSQESIKNFINKIDNIFADKEKIWITKQPIVLYRSIEDNPSLEQRCALNAEGKTFESKSFVSTTTNINTAKRFAHGNPILEIDVPAGTKYIDMDALFNIDREHWREQEFLLPRNSRFVVTGFDDFLDIIKVKYIEQ